jgi:hypothetical protein
MNIRHGWRCGQYVERKSYAVAKCDTEKAFKQGETAALTGMDKYSNQTCQCQRCVSAYDDGFNQGVEQLR